MKTNEIVANNIRKLITVKGWSYAEFLEKAGVSSSYSALLRNATRFNPTVRHLEKFAKVLDVKVTDLLDPGLKIQNYDTELPPTLKKYEVILTEFQYLYLQKWADYNNKLIKEYQEKKLKRYQELQNGF